MNTVLFNINDVALLIVIFECLLLSILILVVRAGRLQSRLMLSLFLLGIGLDALDTLIFWSVELKSLLSVDNTLIFFIFKFSVFIAAPSLYLYIKSILFSDFRLTIKDGIHYVPAILFPGYLYLLFDVLGSEVMARSMFDYEPLFHNPLYQVYLWGRNFSYVGYGIASLILISRYQALIRQGFSSIEEIDQFWLRILVFGFLVIWGGVFASYLGHQLFESFLISDSIGVTGNYLNLLFINSLVVYSLLKTHVFRGVVERSDPVQEAKNVTPSRDHVDAIKSAMEKDDLYMDATLTLEDLARHVSLSSRYVSSIINGNFNKNFFEFVNDYRVEKAKSLLELNSGDITISQLMYEAGFNSKATFNRLFKKSVGMTPSEYRKKFR